MGKLFKIVGGLVALVVILVVVAVVALPMMVDPNDYKGEIVSQVKKQTGRDLTIDGDLKLSVFPWLGVDLGGLRLSNAEGFGDKPFAAVDRAAVRVKLMPLLSSTLEVDTIELQGLELNLAKSKSGQTNWDDLAKGDKSAPSSEQEAPASGSGLAGFSIGGVAINDARIDWDDRSTGQRYTVEQFSLNSGAISTGRPVSLEMGMLLKSAEPQLDAQVNLSGEVSMDQSAGQVAIKGLVLNVDAQGKALQGRSAKLQLMADIAAALDGSQLKLDQLQVTSGDLNLSGSIEGKQLLASPAFSGSLKLAEFNLRQWLSGQGLSVPETADPQVLTKFGASMQLAAEAASTRVENLKLVLDDTQVDGGASLKGEAIGFNLNIDAINLDRYLPPQQAAPAEGGGGAAKGAASTGDEALLPVEMLRKLNLNGTLKLAKLIINKLTAEQVVVKVTAKNGKLNLDHTVGAFYQGAYAGSVDLDVAGKTPLLGIVSKASNIQAGPLLKDMTGKDKLTGSGQFNANLNTRGNSVNAFKKALGGNLGFAFENGAVKGVNLAQTIREAEARFKGQPVPKSDAPQQTDFSELRGTGTISGGVLTNNDLLAKSPFLRVTGNGQVNLVAENMDYLVKTVVVSTAAGQGGAGLEELKGVPIPVRLTGPLTAPDYKVEWGQVLAETQKAKIEEKKQEVKQELKTKLQDKLKGFFR